MGISFLAMGYKSFMLFINLNSKCCEQGSQKCIIGTFKPQVQFGKCNLISYAHMPPHDLILSPYHNSDVGSLKCLIVQEQSEL